MQPVSMVLMTQKENSCPSLKFPHHDCYKAKDDSLHLSWISDCRDSNEKNQINIENRSSGSILRKKLQYNLNAYDQNQPHNSYSSFQSRAQYQSKKALTKSPNPNFARLFIKNSYINKFKRNLLHQAYILQDKLRPKIEQILKLKKKNIQKQEDEVNSIIPIFTPMTPLLYYWDLANLFFDFMSLWYCAYFASILNFQTFDQVFNIIILVNIGLEIVLNFNRSILVDGEYLKNRMTIIKSYLYGAFFWDCVCFFAWLVQTLVPDNKEYFLQSLVVIQIILTVIRVVKSGTVVFHKSFQKTIKVIYWILQLYCLLSCLWYYIGEHTSHLGNSWIIKYQYESKSNTEKYNAAFYWATMTMVTVGYGDLTAANYYEILFSIVLQYYDACIQLCICLFNEFNWNDFKNYLRCKSKIQVQNRFKYRKTLYLMNSYMNENGVNFQIQNKIRNYLKQQNVRGPNENSEELNKIIEDIPQELRLELQLEIQQKILANMKILQRIFSPSTLSLVAQSLQKQMIFPGQVILEQRKTKDDCIHYIQQGSIQVLEERSQNLINNINAGETFGEYQFFTGFLPLQTIKAKEFSIIYKLERKQFLHILKKNHKDFEKFHQIKDEILLYKDFSKLQIKCEICSECSHPDILCPKIMYQPNLEKIIKKEQFSDHVNTRSSIVRNAQKINSLYVFQQIQVSVKSYLQLEASQQLENTNSGYNESPTYLKKLDFKSNTFTVSDNDTPQPNPAAVQMKSITIKSQNVLDPLLPNQGKNQNEQLVQTEINVVKDLEKLNLRFKTNIDKIANFTEYMTQNNVKNVLAKIGKRLPPEKIKIFQDLGKYTFFWNVKQKALKLREYFENGFD